jgi:plastocyanin
MKKLSRALGIVVLTVGFAAATRAAGFEELASSLWTTTLAAMRLQKADQNPSLPKEIPLATDRIVEIAISGFKFSPASVTIAKGDWIRWTNNDGEEHTATGKGRVFDTGTIGAGKTEQVHFTNVGTFAYHCVFHPMMSGQIVVK